MPQHSPRRGISKIAVLVVVIVIGGILAVLIAAVGRSREAARSATCSNKLGKWARAMLKYESQHRRMPMASTVTRNAAGDITAIDGWSYRVALLPYLDGEVPKLDVDVERGRPLEEPADADGTPHADALKTSFPLLLCPSYGGSPYADSKTNREAISNYKVMGATHHESLSVASPQPLKPKYNPKGRHPDGACFPGTALKLNEFLDGTSNTIIFVESVEPHFARWTVGAESTLVGLSPDVEFYTTLRHDCGYYCIKGHEPHAGYYYGDESPAIAKYHTYLNWDYEQEPYDGGDGTVGGKYGPGSHHPHGTFHAFLDGAVRSVPREIDVSTYMFIITRINGDPSLETLSPHYP